LNRLLQNSLVAWNAAEDNDILWRPMWASAPHGPSVSPSLQQQQQQLYNSTASVELHAIVPASHVVNPTNLFSSSPANTAILIGSSHSQSQQVSARRPPTIPCKKSIQNKRKFHNQPIEFGRVTQAKE